MFEPRTLAGALVELGVAFGPVVVPVALLVVPPVNPGAVEGVAGGVTTALLPPAGGTRGGAPSGNTQFTSRSEQKSGMVVRAVDASAADASGAAVRAVRAAATATSIDFGVFMVFLQGEPTDSSGSLWCVVP